jgi:hypothetical protein
MKNLDIDAHGAVSKRSPCNNTIAVAASTVGNAGRRAFGLALAVCSSLGLSACGAAHEGDEAFAEDPADVGTLVEQLNSDLGTCGVADPNVNFTGMFSTHSSPATYNGNNGCGSAYFVNVLDYKTTAAANNKYNNISWGGPVPTTKAACEATQINVYVFERIQYAPECQEDYNYYHCTWFKENHTVSGVWQDAVGFPVGCRVPSVNLDFDGYKASKFTGITKGQDYLFAMRARDITNPYATKKLNLQAKPMLAPHQ